MSQSRDELRAIEDALIESIMNASPEETIAELREQGIDPDASVALMDRKASEAVRAAKRHRLEAAKARAVAFKAIDGGKPDPRDLDAARARVTALKAGGGGLGMMLAARKGTGMSERDEESLADDLARLERLRREEGDT